NLGVQLSTSFSLSSSSSWGSLGMASLEKTVRVRPYLPRPTISSSRSTVAGPSNQADKFVSAQTERPPRTFDISALKFLVADSGNGSPFLGSLIFPSDLKLSDMKP